MLVRWLVIPCSALALLLAGCGGSDSKSTPATKAGATQEIAGQWTGTLTQAGLPPFRVAVLIFDGAGKVAYTGIDCAGEWRLDSGGDGTGSYVFTETIKSGAGGQCKGTGTVRLERVAANRLRYRFEGGGVTSRGVLRPARMSEWTSIFQEAGVQVN